MIDKTETSFLYYLMLLFNKGSGKNQFGIPSQYDVTRKAFHFLESLLEEDQKIKFLDLGCAIGNVMYTAFDILGKYNEFYGIDHNPNYIEVAQYIANRLPKEQQNWTLLQQEINSPETIELIKDIDVVFAYYPIPNTQQMLQMYNMIDTKMKIGAYYMCNDTSIPPKLKNFEEVKVIKQECNCETEDEHAEIIIYRKIL